MMGIGENCILSTTIMRIPYAWATGKSEMANSNNPRAESILLQFHTLQYRQICTFGTKVDKAMHTHCQIEK